MRIPPKGAKLSTFGRILRLTHQWYNTESLAGWIDEDLSNGTVHVDVVPPNDRESRLGRRGSLIWSKVKYESKEQWNWDQDRNAVIGRDKEEEYEIEQRDTEWQGRERRFLKEWEDPIPEVAIRKSRKLLRDTAAQLIELGDAASLRERFSVLQACIENLNALDAKYGFIGTSEREDLCNGFDLLVYACGLKRRKCLADKWRDW